MYQEDLGRGGRARLLQGSGHEPRSRSPRDLRHFRRIREPGVAAANDSRQERTTEAAGGLKQRLLNVSCCRPRGLHPTTFLREDDPRPRSLISGIEAIGGILWDHGVLRIFLARPLGSAGEIMTACITTRPLL